MGVIFKNLLKSLSHLKFARRNNNEQRLLLLQGETNLKKKNILYFSDLSAQDPTPTKQIHFSPLEDFGVAVGSRNGIVCLDNAINEFLLWNPSTGESKIITSGIWNYAPYYLHRLHSFASGFGYDSTSHHLKLVRFMYMFEPVYADEQDSPCTLEEGKTIELYNLNTNSWRRIDHPEPRHFVLRNPSAYVDGFNYWLAYYQETPYILSFDYAKEELCAHDLPKIDGKTLDFKAKGSLLLFDFVDFKGVIGVIVFPKFGADKSFGLWLGHGGKWVKECEFYVPGAERPLGFWDDGRLLFLQGVDGGLMVYDLNMGKTKKLDLYDSSGKMKLLPHVETNVSIRGLLGSSKPPPKKSPYPWLAEPPPEKSPYPWLAERT